MSTILMYIPNGLIIASFVGYFLLILMNKNKKITDNDGFNVTKDILHEYDSINIIEDTGLFTIYNIKRKVIKIASKCYYGNTLSDICIPLMEAGISGVDDKKNKYISFFRKIISNLKHLYILPIIAILINSVTFNLGDAKMGMFLIIIFSIVSYILIEIKNEALLWINNNLKKVKYVDKDKVLNFINKIIMFDKLIFLGELIMIIRFVAIILETIR